MRQLFEAARPGENHWVIAHRRRAKQSFVTPGPDVTLREEWWFRTPRIASDVATADVIVAHSMTTIFASAIRHAHPKAKVVWLGWGYDYYPLLGKLLGNPLLAATQALVGAPNTDPATEFPPPLRWWERLIGRKTPGKTPALIKVADRIHTYSVLPSEVPLLHQAVPALRHARMHELPLFTAEDVFQPGCDSMTGPDLLLGNSATPTNNHAEAFDLLLPHVGERRVVVPLSYGDKTYGEQVAELGRQRLGELIEPLRQWMSIEAYNQRVSRCGFVVMNHRRQQAVGNVGAALYKGATVYLRPENPMFAFYQGLGIHLRSTEELSASGPGLQALSPEQRDDNRRRIGAYYSRSRVVQAIRTLPALQP